MRDWLAAGAMVAVLVLGLGAGYAIGGSTGGGGSSATSTLTTCTTSGPTNGVVLRVVANNGSWSGVKVSGEAVGYCNDEKQSVALGPAVTNATGWVNFLEHGMPGIYFIDVNESGYWTYRVSVVTQPLTTTFAILNLTTGSLETHFCEYGGPIGSAWCPAFPVD